MINNNPFNLADGGPVDPRLGPPGIDTIPANAGGRGINLTGGEFVLPQDTTAQIGVENLQALVDQTHTPRKRKDAYDPFSLDSVTPEVPQAPTDPRAWALDIAEIPQGYADGGVVENPFEAGRRMKSAVQEGFVDNLKTAFNEARGAWKGTMGTPLIVGARLLAHSTPTVTQEQEDAALQRYADQDALTRYADPAAAAAYAEQDARNVANGYADGGFLGLFKGVPRDRAAQIDAAVDAASAPPPPPPPAAVEPAPVDDSGYDGPSSQERIRAIMANIRQGYADGGFLGLFKGVPRDRAAQIDAAVDGAVTPPVQPAPPAAEPVVAQTNESGYDGPTSAEMIRRIMNDIRTGYADGGEVTTPEMEAARKRLSGAFDFYSNPMNRG